MNYQISERMATLQPSLIREILKATSDPSVISFAAGNPSPNAFPTKEIADISNEILTKNPIDALQYSTTEGYTPLREALKQMLKTHYGIPIGDNELIVVSGAQQGADLTAKVLLNEGDTVLCEDPSFIGCLNCFRSYRARLLGIPMCSDGIDPVRLEETIESTPNVKLLYIIPNFQNPTGITTSAEKRREILRICQKHNIVILEDNPYGDLRFKGSPIPAIKSMDTDGTVVYVGSFSKILAPGMRVAFVLAPKPLIAKMTVGKQCVDVHTNILAQMICERWLSKVNLEKHLAHFVEIYSAKANLMLDCIDKEFASSVSVTRPDGGLFLWGTLPKNADMLQFCNKAVEQKVAIVPGTAFLSDQTAPCNSFRMNFSTPTDEMIIEGVKRLGKLTKELF